MRHTLITLQASFYRRAIKPIAQNPDTKRREFILNVILASLFILSVLALFVQVITFILNQNTNGLVSILMTLIFMSGLIVCRIAVLRGRSKLISYIILFGLSLMASLLMLHWSFELPQVLLLFILIIVVASILLNAFMGLLFTGLSALLILVVGFAQIKHNLHPDLTWREKPFVYGDVIGYALVFGIIGLVTWLSNREIDRSLNRARKSEVALLKERDSLEVKVAERTKELERSQLIRVMELQRFAAFGRLSAGLVHELSSPLMAATINLQQLKSSDNKTLIARTQRNLQHLERYIEAARKQLQSDSAITTFSVTHELQHVTNLVKPIAQKVTIQLESSIQPRLRLTGDPIKFNQLIRNLLVNAIESYPKNSDPEKRRVTLTIARLKQGVQIRVHDWGIGITSEQMQHIFEPFYSSKPDPELHMGMGIGLDLVKQFVEHDFNGKLKVTSSPNKGTLFTATLLGTKKEKHRA